MDNWVLGYGENCRLLGAGLLTPVTNYWWPGFPANLSREAYYDQLGADQWAVRIAHYLPWLTYWWNTRRWIPPSNVIAYNPALFSPEDLKQLPKFMDRAAYLVGTQLPTVLLFLFFGGKLPPLGDPTPPLLLRRCGFLSGGSTR